MALSYLRELWRRAGGFLGTRCSLLAFLTLTALSSLAAGAM